MGTAMRFVAGGGSFQRFKSTCCEETPVQGVADDASPTPGPFGPKENDMRKHEPVPTRTWDQSSACVETLEGRTLMAAAGGDTVLEWNKVAVEATQVARLSPNFQTRALAMVHGAV